MPKNRLFQLATLKSGAKRRSQVSDRWSQECKFRSPLVQAIERHAAGASSEQSYAQGFPANRNPAPETFVYQSHRAEKNAMQGSREHRPLVTLNPIFQRRIIQQSSGGRYARSRAH